MAIPLTRASYVYTDPATDVTVAGHVIPAIYPSPIVTPRNEDADLLDEMVVERSYVIGASGLSSNSDGSPVKAAAVPVYFGRSLLEPWTNLLTLAKSLVMGGTLPYKYCKASDSISHTLRNGLTSAVTEMLATFTDAEVGAVSATDIFKGYGLLSYGPKCLYYYVNLMTRFAHGNLLTLDKSTATWTRHDSDNKAGTETTSTVSGPWSASVDYSKTDGTLDTWAQSYVSSTAVTVTIPLEFQWAMKQGIVKTVQLWVRTDSTCYATNFNSSVSHKASSYSPVDCTVNLAAGTITIAAQSQSFDATRGGWPYFVDIRKLSTGYYRYSATSSLVLFAVVDIAPKTALPASWTFTP